MNKCRHGPWLMGHNRVAWHRKKQVPVPPICTVLFSTWISELLRKNLKNSVTKWSTRTPIKKITKKNSSRIPKQTMLKVDLGKQDQKLCQLSRGKTWGRSLVAVGPEIESANIYNRSNNNNKSGKNGSTQLCNSSDKSILSSSHWVWI